MGKRRTQKELLLAKLVELSKGELILIGNKTLRNAIGWDPVKYTRIRDQLRDEGWIISGRGKGGSVSLASAVGSKGLKVFVGYCREDEQLKNELLKHLEPLRRAGMIETWDDRQINPGAEWEEEISEKLNEADLILLLISIDFINSYYCYEVELERALERREAEEAAVIPVILRNCLWRNSNLGQLQALPKDGKAVRSWDDDDDAFVNVAEGVKATVEKLLGDE